MFNRKPIYFDIERITQCSMNVLIFTSLREVNVPLAGPATFPPRTGQKIPCGLVLVRFWFCSNFSPQHRNENIRLSFLKFLRFKMKRIKFLTSWVALGSLPSLLAQSPLSPSLHLHFQL